MQTANILIRRTDGRADKHGVYRIITFNRSCNVLLIRQENKQRTVPNVCHKKKTISNSNSVSILGTASPFHGTTETATFAHFMKKSRHLKTRFLLNYQVLFLLLNGLQIEKDYSLIDRFLSIYDVRRQRHVDFALYLQNGAISSAKHTKDFLFGFY